MNLHHLLDWEFGPDGLERLEELIREGADIEVRQGPLAETPLHVAARRRRCEALWVLLDHGADIDAVTAGGKSAFAHAARRRFHDVVMLLTSRGADQTLGSADQFAIAVLEQRLTEARDMLAARPEVVRTGNPEEDRLLADVAGRPLADSVAFLIESGADLCAPGLDGGTPLHQAAWFGQPLNARLLVRAGANLDVFDPVHGSSPLHWAVHGSRYSGGAAERRSAYAEIVRLLLDAGSSTRYPDEVDEGAYLRRLHSDAPAGIRELLPD